MAPVKTEVMASRIKQSLIESGLNYEVCENPYSMKILLRKSFVRDLARQAGGTNLQQPQHAMLEEAKARIRDLEQAQKLIADRESSSVNKLQIAEHRMQELERCAIEASNSARSLEERLSKADEQIRDLLGQIERDRTASGEKMEGLKSELKVRGEQLKEKSKKLREIENQTVKGMESTEKHNAENRRKIDALIAKNSAIQARLDEAKKTIRLDRSQARNAKRRKEKATQVDSICMAETETVEDKQTKLAALTEAAAQNHGDDPGSGLLKEMTNDNHLGRLLKEKTDMHASTEDEIELDSVETQVVAASDATEKLPESTNYACTATVANVDTPANAEENNKKDTAGTAIVAEENSKDDDDKPGNTKWKTNPRDHPAVTPEYGKPNLDTDLDLNAKEGKQWDQTAGPKANPNPERQPKNAECSDLDSQSEGEAADAESASNETDTNSEDGNEAEALDSRLEDDKTHATDGKNDDTDESESEVATPCECHAMAIPCKSYHEIMPSYRWRGYEEWLKKKHDI